MSAATSAHCDAFEQAACAADVSWSDADLASTACSSEGPDEALLEDLDDGLLQELGVHRPRPPQGPRPAQVYVRKAHVSVGVARPQWPAREGVLAQDFPVKEAQPQRLRSMRAVAMHRRLAREEEEALEQDEDRKLGARFGEQMSVSSLPLRTAFIRSDEEEEVERIIRELLEA